jgi:hypothetical protein
MRNSLRLLVLALVLTPLLGVPLLASEAPQAPPTPAEPAQTEEAPAPEALDELPDLVAPGDDLKFEAIRSCEDTEELQCPSVCSCIFFRNEVHCLGNDPVCTG